MRKLFLFSSIQSSNKFTSTSDSPNIINLDKLESVEFSAQEKLILEKEFIDFIAGLGCSNQSTYWWASALPEKNSLTSKLFIRIFKLLYAEKIIRRQIDDKLILISSDYVVLEQIYDNYKKSFEVRYSKIHRFKFFIFRFYLLLKGFLKQIIFCLKEYHDILFARWKLRKKIASFDNSESRVVLRTWVDQRNYQSGRFKDSYFKDLAEYFKQENKNVLVFAGILNNYKENVIRFAADKNFDIIPVNFFLKGWEIIHCLFIVLFFRPKLYRPIIFMNQNISELVHAELNRDMENTDFIYACLQFFCCHRLAEKICCKRFIYTFENYAWEKMSVQGLRVGGKKIKIIGFQHAFISRNSFKYFPGKKEMNMMPFPDQIATLGHKTLEIMRQYGNYPKDIFIPACALRQEYVFQLKPLSRNVQGDIFIPLTITIEDTLKVLEFLIAAGLDKYKQKIYLRFHPATSVKKVMEQFGHPWPNNFIISDKPLIEEEMKRCSVVLYTWTTVCLEAIKLGRPCIYLDVNYPLEVDPLFEIESLKDVCRNSAELITKVERFIEMDEDTYHQQLESAQHYVNQYLLPVVKENYIGFAN